MNDMPTFLPATLDSSLEEIQKKTDKEKSRVYESSKRKARPEDRHKNTNLARLKKAVASRMVMYQEDALDAVYYLATMDESIWKENSMLAQVKLQAARILAFPEGSTPGNPGDGLAAMLQKLNSEYHSAAPRIRG